MDDKPVNDVSFTAMYYENKWTTTPPTVEGWYWVKHEADNEIIMTQVCKLTDDYLTTENGPLYIFTHWLGPLPAPAPPE
jgi:hypothetical protein